MILETRKSTDWRAWGHCDYEIYSHHWLLQAIVSTAQAWKSTGLMPEPRTQGSSKLRTMRDAIIPGRLAPTSTTREIIEINPNLINPS